MRDLRAHAADGRARDALLAERRRATTSTSARSARRRRSSTAGSRRARRPRRRSAPSAAGAAASRSARCSAPGRARPRRPVATEPILRRLSEQELAMVEAADLFNASQYRRTVGGIAKSLGAPRVSVVAALGRQPRGRRHRRLGHLLVPVPRLARLGQPGAAGGARPRSGRARGLVHRVERAHGRRRPDRPGHRAPVASRLASADSARTLSR